MKGRRVLFIRILIIVFLYSISSHAEIKDTETQRIFSTVKPDCKLITPRSDFMIDKEGLSEKIVIYRLINENRVGMIVRIDTSNNQCNSTKSCLDDLVKSPVYSTAKTLDNYETAGFSVANLSLDIPDGKQNLKMRVIAASQYRLACRIDVVLSLIEQSLSPAEPLLKILNSFSTQ